MGAKLEASGQVRDALPFIVSQAVDESLTVTGAGTFTQPISYSGELPFDMGPDRNGRVFLCISNIGVTIAPNAIGAARFRGHLGIRDQNGMLYHLAAIASDFTADVAENNNVHILLPFPYFSSKPQDLGLLEFSCDAFTVAANVVLRIRANIGFYSDYEG